MSRTRMAETRIAAFLDFDQGFLLVLTEDFQVGKGWTETVRPDFNWWMMKGAGVVGYSIDGLDSGPPDYEFLSSCDYRVMAPQFGLSDAGVGQVAGAAYEHFVVQGKESFANALYREALDCLEGNQCYEDLIRALEKWTLLYHVHGHGDALYWMGVTCAGLGMREQAVSWLLKFLELRYDNPWAHCQLGKLYHELEDNESARMHLEKAVVHETMNGYETGAAGLLTSLENQGQMA